MKNILGSILFFLIVCNGNAQSFTSLSQYMLNQSYLNPAYTGVEQWSITALHRTQWATYEDYHGDNIAPSLQFFNFQYNSINTGHSTGMLLSQDKAGYLTSTMVQASYAYRIQLTQPGTLSLGIRGGIESRSIDFGSYILEHDDDPYIPQGTQTEMQPDFTLGIWYDHKYYYAGISMKSLIAEKSFKELYFRHSRSYIMAGGLHLYTSTPLILTPSIQVIAESDEKRVAINGGLLANYDDILWGGLSYRYGTALSGQLGFSLLEKKIRIGYAMDYVTTNRTVTAATSHEIMLSYVTGKIRRKRMIMKPRKKSRTLFYIQDRDKDGVPDNRDHCIDEPGYKKFNGCPDHDADGVADDKDLCPDLPGSKALNGCPDTDGDGVADPDDKCPDEPGYKELQGCPDADLDGVPDIEDPCPDIPGKKASGGCPESLTQEMLANVIFNTGEATLIESSYVYLDAAVTVLKKYNRTVVRVEGHTDSEGEDQFNLELSIKRAETIREYFVSHGISSERIFIVGHGESEPIDTNDTEEGRRNNRRVEIHFIRNE